MKIHDCKLNFLFYGVEHKPSEVILHLWVSDIGYNDKEATNIEIANAHRLSRNIPEPGQHPIIVRFAFILNVEYFLHCKRKHAYNKDKNLLWCTQISLLISNR